MKKGTNPICPHLSKLCHYLLWRVVFLMLLFVLIVSVFAGSSIGTQIDNSRNISPSPLSHSLSSSSSYVNSSQNANKPPSRDDNSPLSSSLSSLWSALLDDAAPNDDLINVAPEPTTNKLLPNVDPNQTSSAKLSKRNSKLGQDFSPAPATMEPPKSHSHPQPQSRNQPSSMDDIIGGLLQLMGGNMKMPPGQQHPNQATNDSPNKMMANLLNQMSNGGNPMSNQSPNRFPPPHLAHLFPRPPLPGGSFPNPNLAKPPHGRHPPSSPHGSNFMPPNYPMYQIPFIPLLSSGGSRPSIPLNNQALSSPSSSPKLPPNFPPINGMSKAEIEALYHQFLSGTPANRTNLMSNLMSKLAAKPHSDTSSTKLSPPISANNEQDSSGTTSVVWSQAIPNETISLLPPNLKVQSTVVEEPQIITMQEEPSIFEMVVKHKIGPSVSISSTMVAPQRVPATKSVNSEPIARTNSKIYATISPSQTSYVKETSTSEIIHSSSYSQKPKPFSDKPTDIVYGKRLTSKVENSHPKQMSSLMPSFSISKVPTVQESFATQTTQTLSASAIGKPVVMPVEMEGVKPKVEPIRSGSVDPTRTIDASRRVYPTKNVQDFSLNKSKVPPQTQSPKKSQAKPFVRRPSFRPRPNVPIVRIDTCIVGDDSTCDISLNEKCLTELGLSSCQCKPGYARQIPRTACVPVISVAISFRVDRMGGNKLQFTRPLLNPNTEEYQYLEYESIHALNSMFSITKTMSDDLMSVKVNRFYSVGGKTIVNATISLRSNETSVNSQLLKRKLQQELSQAITDSNNVLGESQLAVDSNVASAITRVDDLNECSNGELNDCSKHARCQNEFGGFRCKCETGYEDKHPNDSHRSGRVCSTCSAQYCSNRGECMIVRGERVCRCRANFIGAQCDIDAEVLGVAVGGSIAALIIIVITFICLYMWNQRFKQEQQKIEAMSAASGHTFSYVNKHGPPTMSRMSIDERYGRSWATHYSDSQQHLLPTNAANYYGLQTSEHHNTSTTSPQHVYAQPVRVIASQNNVATGDHNEPSQNYGHQSTWHSRHYQDYGRSANGTRSLKAKNGRSNNSSGLHSGNVAGGGHYPPNYSMKQMTDANYNETEFSTRELIYTPAHMYATNPRTSMPYYS